jgi:hypothetical protein
MDAGTVPDEPAVNTSDSQPPRVSTVRLWSPWMSLLAAILVGGLAAFLAAPVALLVEAAGASPAARRAIVTCSYGIGFLRGAIVFTVLGADRLLVVNPVRIHRRAVGDVERICTTRPRVLRGFWVVLAGAVRGRRRPIAFWSAPLSDMLIPPLRRRQAARLLAVHAWSVQQGIGSLQGVDEWFDAPSPPPASGHNPT